MSQTISLTQKQLPEFLLQVATVRPVMILGVPGIGKSALYALTSVLVRGKGGESRVSPT